MQRRYTNSQQLNILILSALTLGALVTRLFLLGDPALAGDEFFTVMHYEERAASINNPAYYFILTMLSKFVVIDEFYGRLPAALFGIATVPMMFLLWKNIVSPRAALFAALLLLVCEWHLWVSQYSRFYSAVLFLAILNQYAFVRALQDRSGRWLIASLAAGVVASLFHATAALLLLAVGATAAIVLALSYQDGTLQHQKHLLYFVAPSVIGGLILVPFAWEVIVNWQGSGQVWGRSNLGFAAQLAKYIGPTVVVAGGLGWLIGKPSEPGMRLFTAVSLAVMVIVGMFGSIFFPVHPNYVISTLPLVILMAALFCDSIGGDGASATGDLLSKLRRFGFAWGALLLIVVSMLPQTASHYMNRQGVDMRTVSNFLKEQTHPDDAVLSFVTGIDYYADGAYSKAPYMAYAFDGNFAWRKNLDALVAQSPRDVWIVLPIRRRELPAAFESWLMANAALVWRRTTERIDYTVEGFQVFKVTGE